MYPTREIVFRFNKPDDPIPDKLSRMFYEGMKINLEVRSVVCTLQAVEAGDQVYLFIRGPWKVQPRADFQTSNYESVRKKIISGIIAVIFQKITEEEARKKAEMDLLKRSKLLFSLMSLQHERASFSY